LLSAWTSALALASTMSVEAPWPESDLPSIFTWRNTWPTLSRPGVSERRERLSTSICRPRISLIAVKAAAIGPSPVPREARSPAHGPVIRTSAVGLTLPQTTRR
jgi:hypothetical protein